MSTSSYTNVMMGLMPTRVGIPDPEGTPDPTGSRYAVARL